VLAIPFLFQIVNWPDGLNISLGYIGTALGVLIPIFIYAARIYFKRFYLIALAMLSFGAAISFRISDQSLDFLAMGSHWLWHTFGAIAVFLVMQYVFMDNRDAKSKF
jgi:hemolysin III